MISPERALWRSVLEEAVRAAVGTAAQLRWVEQQEARRWLGDLTHEDIGSLRWVCAVLDLRAESVSQQALALRTTHRRKPSKQYGYQQAILAALRKGIPYRTIATRTGVSLSTVYVTARRMGYQRYKVVDMARQLRVA